MSILDYAKASTIIE